MSGAVSSSCCQPETPSSSRAPRRSAQADGRAIVRRFFAWAQQSGAETTGRSGERARARLSPFRPLPPLRAEVAAAMITLIDDPCATVRRALAEAVSGARDAPRHLVVALANDEAQVAAPVLARSPLLTDAELVDCAATRRRRGAMRDRAPARPRRGAGRGAGRSRPARSGAGADRQSDGGPHAAACCAGCSRGFGRRRGNSGSSARAPGLPPSLKVDFALATTKALARFVGSTGWLDGKRAEKIAREARDAALVSIAADCEPQERAELVRTLRERGALTMALICGRCSRAKRELDPRPSPSFPA